MIFDPRKLFFLSLGTVLLMLAVVMAGRAQVASSWHQSDYAPSLLEVETADGLIIGRVSPEGRTWVAPIVARVCNVPRFRRNLRAALSGSTRANRYLTACAKRLGSGHGN